MNANIVTLPGDYIGPEIVAQAVKVLTKVAEKYGHTFSFEECALGGASIDAYGVPLTDETLAKCNAADAVLMGSVGGPKWDGVEPARRPVRAELKGEAIPRTWVAPRSMHGILSSHENNGTGVFLIDN